MAATIAVPRVEAKSAPSSFLQLIPGILLLAAVGYAGKFLEKYLNTTAKAHHWTFPNIEYVLWAIVIGLLISNLITFLRFFCPESPLTSSGSKSGLSCSAPASFSPTS